MDRWLDLDPGLPGSREAPLPKHQAPGVGEEHNALFIPPKKCAEEARRRISELGQETKQQDHREERRQPGERGTHAWGLRGIPLELRCLEQAGWDTSDQGL